ncbi:hypothetical protein [Leifsonia shinshuensis]|uniref:hypothetical protein n=1 Tax=Leifsonia shinshuensis TaxID=150026 RepID=UPI0028659C1C|nr:hypothetical protein [Leifsonia shinshuensis]MDR6969751.1 hypothetical protein [Leifsonia shinshuensis]
MPDEELPPALAEAYGNRKPFGRGLESHPNPKSRRSANVAGATFSGDPRDAAENIVWANSLGAIGVLGGMLHLAVAAIRRVIEDNAARG